jgi:hypothetical protein
MIRVGSQRHKKKKIVESVYRNGDATDALHCVENYVAGRLTSGSGILLRTEKKYNFSICKVMGIFYSPRLVLFVIVLSGGWTRTARANVPLRP